MNTCNNVRAISQILAAIERTVKCLNKPSFTVLVRITMDNGMRYKVPYNVERLDHIRLMDGCLITKNETISLAHIAKIVIIDEVAYSLFREKIAKEIYRIMKGTEDCPDIGGYMQCMQKFINCNKLDIEAVAYNGALDTMQSIDVATDIHEVEVIDQVNYTDTKVSVLEDATFAPERTRVVNNVNVSDGNVVTGISTTEKSIVKDVRDTKVAVSLPISLEEKTVVTRVETNPRISSAVDSIESNDEKVGSVEGIEKAAAVTGFATFKNVEGVLGGITDASNTSTVSYTDYPVQIEGSGDKSGALSIVIEKSAFGYEIPSQKMVIPVVINGELAKQVSVGTARTIHGLNEETSVLTGITGIPTTNDLSIPSTLAADDFVKEIETREVDVAGPVKYTTAQGHLVTGVSTDEINCPDVVDTVQVVSNITPLSETVKTVNQVTAAPLDTQISTTKTDVLESGNIIKEPVLVTETAEVTTTTKEALGGTEIETIQVLSPLNESLEGDIVCAGSGIMTVENDSGNISLYNICDINAVKTKE